MSAANERLFRFCVPPGSHEELATTAIPEIHVLTPSVPLSSEERGGWIPSAAI